jgi:hypothetical protein
MNMNPKPPELTGAESPEASEVQITPESALEILKARFVGLKNRTSIRFETKVYLGNLHRDVFEYILIVFVACVGVGTFVIYDTTDFNPNPNEIDPQIEVIDPESRW